MATSLSNRHKQIFGRVVKLVSEKKLDPDDYTKLVAKVSELVEQFSDMAYDSKRDLEFDIVEDLVRRYEDNYPGVSAALPYLADTDEEDA